MSKCKEITPENINNLKINDLKDCGFSRQKIIYITELSKNFINKKFNINKLKKALFELEDKGKIMLSEEENGMIYLM